MKALLPVAIVEIVQSLIVNTQPNCIIRADLQAPGIGGVRKNGVGMVVALPCFLIGLLKDGPVLGGPQPALCIKGITRKKEGRPLPTS